MARINYRILKRSELLFKTFLGGESYPDDDQCVRFQPSFKIYGSKCQESVQMN